MSNIILTGNEVIDEIAPNNTVPDLVMKVLSVEKPRRIHGTNENASNGYQLFTFIIDNEKGKKIQCNVYGDEVEKFAPKIHKDTIICLKKAVAREANSLHKGNTPFFLRLYTSAEIVCLRNGKDL